MTISTVGTVIPLYNKEPYIARAIASVLAQTRPGDEIIIVDDASTDGSLARINAFQDSRIRVMRLPDPEQGVRSSVLIRRDMLLDAGLIQERCRSGEDKAMWLRVLAITDAISSPRVCSSYYRDIPGAMKETISTNMRHCLCDTPEQMISQS